MTYGDDNTGQGGNEEGSQLHFDCVSKRSDCGRNCNESDGIPVVKFFNWRGAKERRKECPGGASHTCAQGILISAGRVRGTPKRHLTSIARVGA